MGRSGIAGQLLRTWREDYHSQTLMRAGLSCLCTAFFALYHGYLYLSFGSLWHGSIGVFYLLAHGHPGHEPGHGASELGPERRGTGTLPPTDLPRQFRFAAGAGPVADIAHRHDGGAGQTRVHGADPSHRHGGAYTTWKITLASIHIGRQRRRGGGNMLVAELRTVNFIGALVAILTLQNTLIMVKGVQAGQNGMLPVSAASSAVIYGVIMVITLRMLCRGLRQR